MKQKTMVLLNECRNELLLYVIPNLKDRTTQYLYMRFSKSDSATAIYYAIKKAASLRYDYGHACVSVEINGLPSTEMSSILSTKFTINNL